MVFFYFHVTCKRLVEMAHISLTFASRGVVVFLHQRLRRRRRAGSEGGSGFPRLLVLVDFLERFSENLLIDAAEIGHFLLAFVMTSGAARLAFQPLLH